jgi:hypothetical protein
VSSQDAIPNGKSYKTGRGRVTLAQNWSDARLAADWQKEPLASTTVGIRRFNVGTTPAHFIVNRANGIHKSRITVAHSGQRPRAATILDPRTGSKHVAPVISHTASTVSLQADLPVDSVRFVVWDDPKIPAPVGAVQRRSQRILRTSKWDVTAGIGSTQPEAMKAIDLGDWCTWSATWRAFSGHAMYKTTVSASAGRQIFVELGDVRHSARVFWNGREVATLISAPFTMAIPASAVKATNTLAIEVANLMLNGLIGCEKSGNKWQKFYFVGIDYKPFTATSHSELPSGILGPVVIKQEI